MKLKKGDTVIVTIGKDKGKKGKIEKVFSQRSKVLVENINQFKRHTKAMSTDQRSEIVTLTKPLPVSNVALVCPKCEKTARIGYAIMNNQKVRICKKCKEQI